MRQISKFVQDVDTRAALYGVGFEELAALINRRANEIRAARFRAKQPQELQRQKDVEREKQAGKSRRDDWGTQWVRYLKTREVSGVGQSQSQRLSADRNPR